MEGWSSHERILPELLDSKSAIFFTGTFSDEAIENIKKQYEVKEENDIATKANRLFLERLRKKYNIKLTHWCITELGSKRGRIHIHGIFFIKEDQDIKYIKDKIKKEWDFGWNYLGYVDQGKTINYITKYMLKENESGSFTGKGYSLIKKTISGTAMIISGDIS